MYTPRYATHLLHAILVALLMLCGLPIFGADQKPLVINPTTGKTEQLQAGNNLAIPATSKVLIGDTANQPAVGDIRVGNSDSDAYSPFRGKNQQNTTEFKINLAGSVSGTEPSWQNNIVLEGNRNGGLFPLINPSDLMFSAYNGNLKFTTSSTRNLRLTIADAAVTAQIPIVTVDNTGSTSPTTGSIQAGGGLGVVGSQWVGGIGHFGSTTSNGGITLAAANGTSPTLTWTNAAAANHWQMYETLGAGGQQGDLGLFNFGTSANTYTISKTTDVLTLISGLDWSGLTTGAAPPLSAADNGLIFYDKTLQKFRYSANGAAYADLVNAGGGGTVSSVGLALPSFITVSGSPVTGSGTLTGTLATQAANVVFAGPVSGGAATPAFRALVAADMPSGTGTIGGTLTATRVPFASGASTLVDSAKMTFSTTNGLSINLASSGANNLNLGSGSGALLTSSAKTVSIGDFALGAGTTGVVGNVAVGYSALNQTNATSCTAVGYQSLLFSTGVANTAFGYSAGDSITGGANDVIIGKDSDAAAAASGSTVVGTNAFASNDSSIVLGYTAQSTAASQFIAGGDLAPITSVYIGKGVTNATPTAVSINSTGGSGTNIAGAALTIAGGIGTGTGVGGAINLQTALAGTTGSALNTLTTRFSVLQAGATDWTGIATASQPALSAANHGSIYYDSTAQAFYTSRNGAAYAALPAAFNPSTAMSFYDDFLHNATPTQFLVTGGVTGAVTWSPTAVVAHPGYARLTTGVNIAGDVSLDIGSINAMQPGGGVLTFETVIMLATLSDGTNTYRAQIGFNDGAQVIPVNKGVYFSYTHSENSGQWRIAVNDAGSPGFSNTSVAVVAGTWVRLGLSFAADGTTCDAFINGTNVGTVSTNPANAGSFGAGIVKTAGTSARTLDVDYISVNQALTTPR